MKIRIHNNQINMITGPLLQGNASIILVFFGYTWWSYPYGLNEPKWRSIDIDPWNKEKFKMTNISLYILYPLF